MQSTHTSKAFHCALAPSEMQVRVYTLIESAQKPRGASSDATHIAPFKGKLFDETNDHLTPTHTKKQGRTIRYYISNRLIKSKDPTGWRLPASTIEEAVVHAIKAHLKHHQTQHTIFECDDIASLKDLHARLDIDTLNATDLLETIETIHLHQEQINIRLDKESLSKLLVSQANKVAQCVINLSTAMTLKKRGVETKIIIGDFEAQPNQNLINTLRQAHLWLAEIKTGKAPAQIAHEQDINVDYFRKRIGLALLSPKIQKAITTGKHPDDWSVAKFVKKSVPSDWSAQEKLFFGRSVIP